jgi:hypothetical protein
LSCMFHIGQNKRILFILFHIHFVFYIPAAPVYGVPLS